MKKYNLLLLVSLFILLFCHSCHQSSANKDKMKINVKIYKEELIKNNRFWYVIFNKNTSSCAYYISNVKLIEFNSIVWSFSANVTSQLDKQNIEEIGECQICIKDFSNEMQTKIKQLPEIAEIVIENQNMDSVVSW